MTNHYSPKTFLRQTSNDLLRQCFTEKGALDDLPWDEFGEHKIDDVYEGWQELPADERVAFERCFEDTEELANDQGMSRLTGPDLVDRLAHFLHDVKSIEHVNRAGGLLGDHLQVRLPHVTANELQLACTFFAQHSKEPQERLGRSIFADP